MSGGLPTAKTDLADVYRRTYVALVRCAYAIVIDRSEAEDVVQEVFGRAVERWSRLQTYDNVVAWLYLVTIREARRRRRRSHRREALSEATVGATSTDGPATEIVDLLRAVQDLPRRQREAILMTAILGYTHREAADILQCSESTLRVHAHRARRALSRRVREPTDGGT